MLFGLLVHYKFKIQEVKSLNGDGEIVVRLDLEVFLSLHLTREAPPGDQRHWNYRHGKCVNIVS